MKKKKVDLCDPTVGCGFLESAKPTPSLAQTDTLLQGPGTESLFTHMKHLMTSSPPTYDTLTTRTRTT